MHGTFPDADGVGWLTDYQHDYIVLRADLLTPNLDHADVLARMTQAREGYYAADQKWQAHA